jgi:tetratricopeptide (TPR) repeat protein
VKKLASLTLMLIAGLALTGCQRVVTKSSPPEGRQVRSTATPKLPFPKPAAGAQELDEDLLYSFLVGEIGIRSGDFEEALKYYLHAAMLGRSAYAAERATRIALHLKDYERGLRAARRWIELAPNSIVARQLGALLFLRNGQTDLAKQQFEAVLRIAESEGKDGMLQIAAALSAEPDNANALQVMQSLADERPDDARTHYAMAVVETAQQRYPEAENSLREAIRLKPDWSQPRVLLSRVLLTLGHAEQAEQQLGAAVERYPDDKALRTSYARLLVSNEQYPQALAQFRTLVDRSPKDDELRYGYAMLATQQHQWAQARQAWQKLRASARYRDEASYFLAQVEQAEGHRDLAIGLYRSVGPGELKVDAVIRLSSLLAETGRLDEAREALSQARIAEPDRAVDLYLAEAQLLQ